MHLPNCPCFVVESPVIPGLPNVPQGCEDEMHGLPNVPQGCEDEMHVVV